VWMNNAFVDDPDERMKRCYNKEDCLTVLLLRYLTRAKNRRVATLSSLVYSRLSGQHRKLTKNERLRPKKDFKTRLSARSKSPWAKKYTCLLLIAIK